MMSVSISINGEPIFARSAGNKGERPGGVSEDLVDEGSRILHVPGDGAVALAIEMLKTIKEQRA